MTTPTNGSGSPGDADADAGQAGQPLPGARLAEELRLLLDALAERAQPMLDRLAAAPTGEHGEHLPATCGWCPVCAGLAVLRGERPELAVRAAERAANLLAALRAALATEPQAPADAEPASGAAQPAPAAGDDDRIQHIPVRRREADKDGEC